MTFYCRYPFVSRTVQCNYRVRQLKTDNGRCFPPNFLTNTFPFIICTLAWCHQMVSNSAAGAYNTVTGRPIRVAKLFKLNNHRAVGTRTDLFLTTSHQWRYRSGRSQITDMVTSPLPLQPVTPCLHLKAQRRPGTSEKGAAKFRSRFKWTSTTQENVSIHIWAPLILDNRMSYNVYQLCKRKCFTLQFWQKRPLLPAPPVATSMSPTAVSHISQGLLSFKHWSVTMHGVPCVASSRHSSRWQKLSVGTHQAALGVVCRWPAELVHSVLTAVVAAGALLGVRAMSK